MTFIGDLIKMTISTNAGDRKMIDLADKVIAEIKTYEYPVEELADFTAVEQITLEIAFVKGQAWLGSGGTYRKVADGKIV